MKKIGIVGAGVMGLTIIKKLLAADMNVVAYDVFKGSREKAATLGAHVVNSPREVVEQVSIILLLLPGPVQVASSITGEEGILVADCRNKIIVDMCTSDPGVTKEMCRLAEEKGADYLDAPILGRPSTVGNWALPVGGNIESLKLCEGILKTIATNIIHIGESGNGHKVKLLNQMMFGAINAMTAEMMAISEKVGVDPGLLYSTILSSKAGTVSNLFAELGKRVSENTYDTPTFTVDLLIKDVKLGIQMAKEYNAQPILGQTVEMINAIAKSQGYGSKDTSIMWKEYKSIWNGFA